MSVSTILNPNERQQKWKALNVNTIQSNYQSLNMLQIANVTDVTYSALAGDLFDTTYYIGSGSATTSFVLPTVANLRAAILAAGASFVQNISFQFKVGNAKNVTVPLSDGGDTNWNFLTSKTFPLLAQTSTIFTVIIGGSGGAYIQD